MSPCRIALVQQKASLNQAANLEKGLEALSKAASQGADLVAYSELAFERFYPQFRGAETPLERAETIPGPTVEAFQRRAAELGVVVILNLYERDGDQAYDCSPVIDADGTLLGRTRMVHITDYEGFHEQDYYSPGAGDQLVFTTTVGRVGVAICYDRHFPESMRALALQGAELVVVPQAGTVGEWPAGLYEAELQVASFQNGYFCALCNRVGGEDALNFAGESFVTNPSGEVVARAGSETEEILYADLDLAEVERSHARRLFLRDRRPELYRGWFSSENESRTD